MSESYKNISDLKLSYLKSVGICFPILFQNLFLVCIRITIQRTFIVRQQLIKKSAFSQLALIVYLIVTDLDTSAISQGGYNDNIINYSAEPTSRIDLVFTISYEDDVDKVLVMEADGIVGFKSMSLSGLVDKLTSDICFYMCIPKNPNNK